jgi:cytochrome c biogenesis protein CcdA
VLVLLRTVLSLGLLWTFIVPAAQAATPMHIFVREGCAHCAALEAFLASPEARPADFIIRTHDLADPQAQADFEALTERAKLPRATPVMVIGSTIFQGFSTPETTGQRLLAAAAKETATSPSLEQLISGEVPFNTQAGDAGCDETGATPCTLSDDALLVDIPLLGSVDLRAWSLPSIAIVLGFVDGFNPCAMWVLVTFLLVLLQIEDRRKMWQIAGLFIVAEAFMYYLILNVWFTTWDFIGLDRIVTPIVGLVAMGGGCFFLYEGLMSDGSCKVTNLKQRQKIHGRIRAIASVPFTLGTALAVIGLALSVNIIEFACSIGIPQAFTKLLELNLLTWVEQQLLLALYITFYMIDDLIVFGLAAWGSGQLHLTQQYAKTSNLIGGILMIILGALLLFWPDLLRFS